MIRVAALYVDPRGPYVSMPDVDPWDEARDARLYAGLWPVVAHPPCGPWGRLSHFCTKQDPDLAPLAVEQVRRWGGVLEHPEGSRLWKHCRLPMPIDPMVPSLQIPLVGHDDHGGFSIVVDQCRWGHRARKRTWLYLVGCVSSGPIPEWQEPTRLAACPPKTQFPGPGRSRVFMGREEARKTPLDFARWLVDIAATVPEWRDPTRYPSGDVPGRNMGPEERRITPPAFARFLVDLAAVSRPRRTTNVPGD